MARTGVVKRSFPYAADGVNIENLTEGRVLSFPDRIFDGLSEGGYIEASKKDPQNSATEAAERDVGFDDLDQWLRGMSDADLKAIIARRGSPVSGNLIHAEMIDAAKAQIRREREGAAPASGVDPTAGVTEQPLAAPGAPVPPAAPDVVRDQLGDQHPERSPKRARVAK